MSQVQMQRNDDKIIYGLAGDFEQLCLIYQEAYLQFYNKRFDLPRIGRLFEITEQLERIRLNELKKFIIFQNGVKITYFDTGSLKPESFDDIDIIDIFKFILCCEENLLKGLNYKILVFGENWDNEISSFFLNRYMCRLWKLVDRRKEQINILENYGPSVLEYIELNWEIRYLESKLKYESKQRIALPGYVRFKGSDKRY